MRREISSSYTLHYKILLIIIFGIIIPIFSLWDFNKFSNGDFIMSIVWIFFVVTILKEAMNLKKVETVSDGLYISQKHFSRQMEIFVPFENIKIVKQKNYWLKGKFEKIHLEFENRTKFGTEIKFISKTRNIGVYQHPVIEELNRQIQTAKTQMQLKIPTP